MQDDLSNREHLDGCRIAQERFNELRQVYQNAMQSVESAERARSMAARLVFAEIRSINRHARALGEAGVPVPVVIEDKEFYSDTVRSMQDAELQTELENIGRAQGFDQFTN